SLRASLSLLLKIIFPLLIYVLTLANPIASKLFLSSLMLIMLFPPTFTPRSSATNTLRLDFDLVMAVFNSNIIPSPLTHGPAIASSQKEPRYETPRPCTTVDLFSDPGCFRANVSRHHPRHGHGFQWSARHRRKGHGHE